MPVLTLGGLFAGASIHQRRRLLQTGPAHRVRLDDDTAVHVQYLRGPLAPHASVKLDVQHANATNASLRAQNTQHVRETVAAHEGNVSAAARQLGISRTTLYKLIRA